MLAFDHRELDLCRPVHQLAVTDDVDEIERDILDPRVETHGNLAAALKPGSVDNLAGKAVIGIISSRLSVATASSLKIVCAPNFV